MRFFQYAQVVKPNWTDAVFGETLAHFKLKQFKEARKCVELALSTYEEGSAEGRDILKFIRAMCNKNIGNYAEATEQYHDLRKIFGRNEGNKLMSHTLNLILQPLNSSRI